MIIYVLQNLYNAPWPKIFNPTGFIHPDEDASNILSASEINFRNFSHAEMDQMAVAIFKENEDLKITDPVWWAAYVAPIHNYKNIQALLAEMAKAAPRKRITN